MDRICTNCSSLCKGCLTSEWYKTQAINPSNIAPAERTSMPPQPLVYLSAVDEPCVRIQLGSRNQVFGDTSINMAFTNNTTPSATSMLQPRMIFIINTHNCAHKY